MQRASRQTTRGITGRQRAVRCAVFCCIALLALLMFVQAVHVHPVGSNPDQCPICVAMHSAAPAATPTAVVVLAHASTPILPVVLFAAARPWHYTLYNRPPPVIA